MITYKQVDESYFQEYEKIPMLVEVKTILKLEKLNNGIGGIQFVEIPVSQYIKDLSIYEVPTEYLSKFDISNWVFFMAFDDEYPVGAVTVVSRTKNVNMLDGRNDMTVLWDIRIDDKYKHMGIGTKLFDMAVKWSKENGFKQIKIETQNINVPSCKFYAKQGCKLGEVNEYAYYNDPDAKNEVQLIWYLDL